MICLITKISQTVIGHLHFHYVTRNHEQDVQTKKKKSLQLFDNKICRYVCKKKKKCRGS